MTKREVVKQVLRGETPDYTPWSFRFTMEPKQELSQHFNCSEEDLILHTGCHILELGSDIGFFEDLGDNRFRDTFGVVWDRSQDRDIGIPERYLLMEVEDLEALVFPDPRDPRYFSDIKERVAKFPDRFRMFNIGFSLFERAWTLRSMEELLMDMLEEPDFVHDLLARIADYNIAQVEEAMKYDIDAVYFGDDWGQQSGLIMGYKKWKEYLYPQLKRMYSAVRDHGKFLFIHSCGDVDELFDDLVALGLNCFNPFQPEVMDIEYLHSRYRGRLAFWGGLSTQSTLPFKDAAFVRSSSRDLLQMGRSGSYIFSPSHAVESDVPIENILAFLDEARIQSCQAGFP